MRYMANLTRLVWRWTGFPGAPGFTNFYHLAAGSKTPSEAAAAERLLFDGVKANLPPSVKIDVDEAFTIWDSVTGDLSSASTLSAVPAQVVGTGATTFAGPTGAVVNWLTATPKGTRLMRGRSFLVPYSTSAFEANGTLSSVALIATQNAAQAMLTALGPNLVIWSKPTEENTPAIGPVTEVRVPDKAVVLRSRRD